VRACRSAPAEAQRSELLNVCTTATATGDVTKLTNVETPYNAAMAQRCCVRAATAARQGVTRRKTRRRQGAAQCSKPLLLEVPNSSGGASQKHRKERKGKDRCPLYPLPEMYHRIVTHAAAQLSRLRYVPWHPHAHSELTHCGCFECGPYRTGVLELYHLVGVVERERETSRERERTNLPYPTGTTHSRTLLTLQPGINDSLACSPNLVWPPPLVVIELEVAESSS